MKIPFVFFILSLSWFGRIRNHGSMVKPYSWFDRKTWIKTDAGYVYDYFGMKSGLMCDPGRDIQQDKICPEHPEDCGVFPYPGASCMWYNNYTSIKKPTLFDPKLRTYPHVEDEEFVLYHPWRAPGSAPVDSPCGVAGGNLNGCKGGCSVYAGGYPHGPKAEDFQFQHKIFVTNWTRGNDVEVAWGINANHGGGYSYRLCKVPDSGMSGLTEECFQRTPLRFVDDTQWVQYGEDESTRKAFPAVRVDQGTFPKGSQWTKNPIPACNGKHGGILDLKPNCPHGTQFPPAVDGLCGYGINSHNTLKKFQFSIIDKVHIPKELLSGSYVLSFRWDAEQSPQVWNTCSSIFLH